MCLVGTLLYGNNMPSFQSLHFRSKSDSLNYIYYNIYIFIFIYRHTFYYISPVSPPGSILRTLIYYIYCWLGCTGFVHFGYREYICCWGSLLLQQQGPSKKLVKRNKNWISYNCTFVCLLLLVAVAHTVNKL